MSITSVKSEVKELKERLNPDRSVIRVMFHFHGEGEPHGFMGSQWLVVEEHKRTTLEAATTEEELESFSRREYAEILETNPHMKNNPNHVWGTYEKWIEAHRCTCGHHGDNGRQPFFGISTLLKEYESLSSEEKRAQAKEILEAYKNGELSSN